MRYFPASITYVVRYYRQPSPKLTGMDEATQLYLAHQSGDTSFTFPTRFAEAAETVILGTLSSHKNNNSETLKERVLFRDGIYLFALF